MNEDRPKRSPEKGIFVSSPIEIIKVGEPLSNSDEITKAIERRRGMNEILRALIKWTEDNQVVPEIYFTSACGCIWLCLKLSYNGKRMLHEFYVPGGVLSLQNWDMTPMEQEVNHFIDEAKAYLLGKGEKE